MATSPRSALATGRSGNETSYDKNGFALDIAAKKTVEFAKAMRAADPAIRLVAWGDSGWAGRMADAVGEHVQYLAFHHMFDPDSPQKPVLRGEFYRRDPDATWEQLMAAWQANDAKIRSVRESLGSRRIPLAMTECHFAIPGAIAATSSPRGQPACPTPAF